MKKTVIVNNTLVIKVERRFRQYTHIEEKFDDLNYYIMMSKTECLNDDAIKTIQEVINLKIKVLRKIINAIIRENKHVISNHSIYGNESIMSNHYLFFKLNSLKSINVDYKKELRLHKK